MNQTDTNNSEFYHPMFQDDESIDIKRYISLFISNWYWFAIFLFLSLMLSYGINRYSQEIFSVSSSLLIKDETLGGYSGMEPIFPGTGMYKNQQTLKNEIGILRSYELNRMVTDSLPEFHVAYLLIGRRGIAEQIKYKDIPFIVTRDESYGERPGLSFSLKIKDSRTFLIGIKGASETEREGTFGDTFTNEDFRTGGMKYRFTVSLRDPANYRFDESLSNRYNFYFPNPDNVANEYRNKLVISPVEENATLVVLNITGPVPQKEIDYLNMLMKLYINRGLNEKNQASEQTIAFINHQLGSIQDSLRAAEDSLQTFRLRNRLTDISIEGSSIRSRLEKYENERFLLMLKKRYFNYLSDYLDSKNQTGDIISPSVLDIDDPVLERLVADLFAAQQQKSQMMLNLSPGLPVFEMLDKKIITTRDALKENIKNSLHTLGISIAEANNRIMEVNRELSKLPDTEKGLIRIQRKYDLNNTVYNYLLEKRAEASITKASNVADNKIIDYAGLYNVTQVRPRKSHNNMLALIAGLVIPMVLILLIDYLNNKIIDRKDVERLTNAPVLGYISHSDFKTDTPVLTRPSSTISESFRSVRTSLKFFIGDIPNPVILITSTVVAEGKTFISVNLASIISKLGKKVLLIGLDLRKPKIHKIFNIDNENGLSRYLSGDSEFRDVVFKTSEENLYYAGSGPVPPNPAELIESARMNQFLTEARKNFDYVIIDTPPIAIVTDALLLAGLVDMNIFVVRQRYTSKNTISLIQEFYESRKLKNLAILINDISLSGYYGYGLRYGYTMRYGGYAYGYNLYGDYVSARYGYSKEGTDYYTEDEDI